MAGSVQNSVPNFEKPPPRNLHFPNANITAVELLTFLPRCLSSADVVYRFVSNQGTRESILSTINTNRMTKKAWDLNYLYRTTSAAMKDAGHGDWTFNKHAKFFEEALQNWNDASLSVSGFKTKCERSGIGKPDEDIPFARLANGVSNMPEGDDALDLTRMILHCVRNPSESWMYPSQYDLLLQHLGGPKELSAEAVDRLAFKRWENRATHMPRGSKQSALAYQLEARGPGSSPTVQTEAQAPRRSDRRGCPSLKRRELLEVVELFGAETARLQEEDEMYVPGPIRWIKPPPASEIISIQALQDASELQPSFRNDDKFRAYAFGNGPRSDPPFRPLHLVKIDELKSDDLSGWAENLRWAAEQYTTFEETGWTECPGHMEQIAEIRIERTWASAALVLAIADEQVVEREDEGWIEAMVEGTLASMNKREPHPRMSILGDKAEEFVDARGVLQIRPRRWRPC